MTAWTVNTREERDGAISTLADLTRLLYRLNVTNHPTLVMDSPNKASVYRHIRQGAEALCIQLGWDPETVISRAVTGHETLSSIAIDLGEYE